MGFALTGTEVQMRFLLLLAALGSFVGFAGDALGHGGSFGHARRGPDRVPSMACDCARVSCPACSAPGLESGEGVSERTTVETLGRWGEIGRVRIRTTFAAEVDPQFLEAAVRVEQAPLLAITSGTVRCVAETLTGVLRPSQRARRDYLWERDTRVRDPMLVLRRTASVVDVRVFPVSTRGTTTVELEGYVLLRHESPGGPRAYRTEDLFLVVLPPSADETAPDLVDDAGGRTVRFLSDVEMKALHPGLVARAVDVPCVPALRDAVLGTGDAAVTESTALVALPSGSQAPTSLFIGRAQDAPLLTATRALDATDPTPPPPPQLPVR